jgi:hypothetical protein
VYDTAGFLPYLAFDGLDDTLNLSNLNLLQNVGYAFSCVGFLANADSQCIFAASTTGSATTNRFGVFSGTSGEVISGIARREDSEVSATVSSAGTFAVNNFVGTVYANYQTGAVTARSNGVAGASGTLPTTGNTSNTASAAINVASLGGTSNFLSGNIYSLILRIADTSAGQIAATEQWVAGKTGVSI